jgi:hypothetical protein
MEVFARLVDAEEDSREVLELVAEVEEALKIESKKVSIFRDSDVKSLRRIVLAFAVGFFQEMNGCALIAYFSAILFSQNLGFSEAESLLLGGFLNLAYWCGSLPNIWSYDYFGRRRVLLVGSTLMTISCVFIHLIPLTAEWFYLPSALPSTQKRRNISALS